MSIAILAVSTASILIRFAQRDAPSITIAALRLAFATALLAPIALTRYRTQLRSIRGPELLLAAISGLLLALHFATWISSLEFTSVASSVVIVSTGPIWVAILSRVFLRERLARAAVLGLGLAVAGGFVIGAADTCVWDGALKCGSLTAAMHGRTLWGNSLALVGAWAVSGYFLVGRHLRLRLQLVPYIFLVYGFAAIGLLATAAATRQPLLQLKPMTYAWLLLLALVPQLIGHSTYNWALRFLPAAMVAVASLGEPVGSAVLAFLILGEQPAPLALAGGSLVLLGILLAALAARAATVTST